MESRVCVVVLNWNGREDSLRCLELLLEQDCPEMGLLFVDNGSRDGSEGAVRERFPELEILQTGSNLGFAGGNNRGIEWALNAGFDRVLLLNNDTLPEAGMVSAMMREMNRHERCGIVGAAIPYADHPEKLWAWGGGHFHLESGRVLHIQAPVSEDELLPQGYRHFYITGCAMLLSRPMLEEIGALDPSYFHFCEDVDLCLRAQRAGWSLAVAGDAKVLHRVSATTRVSSPLFLYYNLRSRLKLVERFGPEGAPTKLRLAVLWLRLWRPALQSGMPLSGWKALGQAYQDFRAGKEGPAPNHLGGRR